MLPLCCCKSADKRRGVCAVKRRGGTGREGKVSDRLSIRATSGWGGLAVSGTQLGARNGEEEVKSHMCDVLLWRA